MVVLNFLGFLVLAFAGASFAEMKGEIYGCPKFCLKLSWSIRSATIS